MWLSGKPIVRHSILAAAVAGSILLVVQAWAPVFQRAFDNVQPGWRALMGVALILVAAAFTDLDVRTRDGHLKKPVHSVA